MKLTENSITVKVSKTVQERQFEPFQVSIEETRIFPGTIKNVKRVRKNLYDELEMQLNEIISEKLNN